MPEPTTIGAAILRHAELRPNSPAIVATGFEPLSYRDLQDYLVHTAAYLCQTGLGRSARVAVILPNNAGAALVMVAVACTAVAVPIDMKLTASEIERRMELLRPDAVIVSGDSPSVAREIAMRLGLTVIEASFGFPGRLGLDLSASQVAPPNGNVKSQPDPPAFILQTSGTTADPKLVPVSHLNTLAAASRVQTWFGLGPADRCLSVSPICYLHGLTLTVFIPLITGGSVAFPASISALDVNEWLNLLRPTWYSAGPTLHRFMLDKAKPLHNVRSLHTLRFIVSGGAPLMRDVQEGLAATFGVPVLEHYGSTEASQICSNLPPPGPSRPGTCGIPVEGTVRIVAENGRELPVGERGQVLIGGPTVISGYLDAPELNDVAFVDGWFRTGDVGSLDADGFLTLHGREKELINRGGEKISPVEIDDALLQHPEVVEAAAFAVHHPRLGEDIAAAVVLRSGATATPMDLRNFVRQRLSAFKVPQRIYVVDALPKGNTGKILRDSLRDVAIRNERTHAPPRETIEIQIMEIWQRLLKTDQIGIDDDFFEAGGDSLLAAQMLLEVESVVSRQIPTSALSEVSTIRGLAAIAIAAHGGDGEPELLTKAHDALGTPFFFCHGDFGGRGFYALKLARLIDPPQPVYLIHPLPDLDENPDLSIEAMARLYVPLLLTVRPEGPFRLGGHCNGGLLAFEIANQLTRLGREVELVVLIESFSLNCRWPLRLANQIIRSVGTIAPSTKFRRRLAQAGMPFVWRKYCDIIPALNRFDPILAAREIMRSARYALLRDRKGGVEFASQAERQHVAYFRKMANYIPPKLNSTIVTIIAEKETSNPLNPPGSWKSRVPVVRQETVPGDHLGCITTEVEALAKCVSRYLEGS